MTDWNQLDAMGDLARLNQARDLARQQAARDSQLAAQNAEVVRLLKEQGEREAAEKARLQAMPKCPECLQPVEIEARRCPSCRAQIATLIFTSGLYPLRTTCREADLTSLLQGRCDTIIRDAIQCKTRCVNSLASIDESWRRDATKASNSLHTGLAKFNRESQGLVLKLLRQNKTQGRMLSPKDEATISKARSDVEQNHQTMLREVEAKCPEQLIMEWGRKAHAKTTPIGGLPIVLAIGGAIWAGVAGVLMVGVTPIHREDMVTFGCGLACLMAGILLGLYQKARAALHEQRKVLAAANVSQLREIRAKELARVRESHDKQLAAINAEEQRLSLAWRQKLSGSDLFSHYGSLASLIERATSARDELAVHHHAKLRRTLAALAETLDEGARLGSHVRCPLGTTGTAVEAATALSLRAPCVELSLNETAICSADDIEATFKSFQEAQAAVASLRI